VGGQQRKESEAAENLAKIILGSKGKGLLLRRFETTM